MKTRKIQSYAFNYIKYNCEHNYTINHGFFNSHNTNVGYIYQSKTKGFFLKRDK